MYRYESFASIHYAQHLAYKNMPISQQDNNWIQLNKYGISISFQKLETKIHLILWTLKIVEWHNILLFDILHFICQITYNRIFTIAYWIRFGTFYEKTWWEKYLNEWYVICTYSCVCMLLAMIRLKTMILYR